MNFYIKKLSKISFYEIKPGLERINKVLTCLGNPQEKIKSVLIAGTNGKGSVTSILSSILICNGYKTGLYTSPHLISITERIKINKTEISEHDFDNTLGTIFDACEVTDTVLSYFEIVTASAFLYFEQQKIDIGILEVGMGGRWDATNVVNPLVSIITNISFDHMEHLGNTLELIASEKAEIIKDKVPVVSGVTGSEKKVLTEKVKITDSNIYFIDEDFNFVNNDDNTFNYNGIKHNFKNLSTNLSGKHQIVNSSLAVATVELLESLYEYKIDFENISKPLKSVNYEGRIEIIRTDPLLILDAAHNTAAAVALVDAISDLRENKFVFLISMLSDKNHEEFVQKLSQIAKRVIITSIPNERAAETKMLFDVTKQYVDNVEIIEDYKEAYEYVKKLNTHVCITGSIYLIGLIKENINKDPEINSE